MSLLRCIYKRSKSLVWYGLSRWGWTFTKGTLISTATKSNFSRWSCQRRICNRDECCLCRRPLRCAGLVLSFLLQLRAISLGGLAGGGSAILMIAFCAAVMWTVKMLESHHFCQLHLFVT